jgi:predicted amidophosphoribosyltransferase
VPTVAELSAPYGNFMLGPRRGSDVCGVCFNLTDGYGRCYACAHGGRWLNAVAPISYSVAGEQLHHALAAYKRGGSTVARRLGVELAAVLWRHLAEHEPCVARAAGVEAFELVTTVPSSDRAHDQTHPLRLLVGELVGPTRERYRPLLSRSDTVVAAHEFSARKFEAQMEIADRSILLIDDTWTTGANAQSAGAALKAAGAGAVAVVVMGRYLNWGWHDNDRRLRGLRPPFDWHRCALCPDPQDVG